MTKRSAPTLPHAARFEASAVVQWTIALGAGIAASPGARLLNPGDLGGSGPSFRAAVVVSTVLLSTALVRFALRRASAGSAFTFCLVGGAIAGALNAGIALAAMPLIDGGDVLRALQALFMGTLFGAIFAGPLGAAYGCVYALVVGPAVKARLRPSHEGGDYVLSLCGAWLAVIGAVVLLANPRGEVEPQSGMIAALMGVVASVIGLARLSARRRFVRRVLAGLAPGFAIVPRKMTPDEASLLPMASEGPWDAVLVAQGHVGSGPYRSGEGALPLALTTWVDAA